MTYSTKGLKLIGKGQFSRVWDLGNGDALIKSCCPVKECTSMGWMPEGVNWPRIQLLDVEDNGLQVYQMIKYNRVPSLKNSLDNDQYDLYSTLRKLWQNMPCVRPHKRFNLDVIHNMFASSTLPEDTKAEFQEAVDAMGNYTQLLGFEISPRNVAVSDGKLILLDVFFDIEARKRRKSYTHPEGRKVTQ